VGSRRSIRRWRQFAGRYLCRPASSPKTIERMGMLCLVQEMRIGTTQRSSDPVSCSPNSLNALGVRVLADHVSIWNPAPGRSARLRCNHFSSSSFSTGEDTDAKINASSGNSNAVAVCISDVMTCPSSLGAGTAPVRTVAILGELRAATMPAHRDKGGGLAQSARGTRPVTTPPPQ